MLHGSIRPSNHPRAFPRERCESTPTSNRPSARRSVRALRTAPIDWPSWSGHSPGEPRNRSRFTSVNSPAKPGETKNLRALCFWTPGNEGNHGNERDKQQEGGVELVPAAQEGKTQAARLRALRGRTASWSAGARGECPRTLRVRGTPGLAGVALAVRPATSRAVRGPPNEDFGSPPGPREQGRLHAVDGFDDEAAGPSWAGGGQNAQPLKSFASFSVSRSRIIASTPTAVKVVPHSM